MGQASFNRMRREAAEKTASPIPTEQPIKEPKTDFHEMTIKELRTYAIEKGIELPDTIKSKEDIINHISGE